MGIEAQPPQRLRLFKPISAPPIFAWCKSQKLYPPFQWNTSHTCEKIHVVICSKQRLDCKWLLLSRHPKERNAMLCPASIAGLLEIMPATVDQSEHETETNDVNLLQVSVTPQEWNSKPKSWPWPWPWDMVELRCETGVFFLWEDADIQQLWSSRRSFVLKPSFEPLLLLRAPKLEFKFVGEIYTCLGMPRTYNIRLWWLI